METQTKKANRKSVSWFVIFIVAAAITLVFGPVSFVDSLRSGMPVLLCIVPIVGAAVTVAALALSLANSSVVEEAEEQKKE